MVDENIAAEVTPTDRQRAGQAAQALVRRGFRVLHIGSSITVEASQSEWEANFGVSFSPYTKTIQEELGRQATYLRAEVDSVRIPADLEDLVADVAFIEPPELHSPEP